VLIRRSGLNRITSTHEKQAVIQSILTNLARFLATLKNNAEQLTDRQRWRAILCRAFANSLLRPTYLNPV